MDILDVLVGGGFGLILSVLVQSYFRPVSAAIESRSRRRWSSPVLIHVERDPAIIWHDAPDWVGFQVYVDDPTRFAGPTPSERTKWLRWMKARNAVDAYTTPLQVTIQARTEAAVVIEGLLLKRHRSVPLSSGAILVRAPAGGADLEPRRFEVHLDRELVDVDWLLSTGNPGRPPSLVLAAGDIERFHIWATTSHDSEDAVRHEWTVELLLLVEGKRQTEVIDDDGKPFVTVTPGNLSSHFNTPGSDDWDGNPPSAAS
ncbi:hypothetical protein I4I73_17460 [Pseudonocardia sp. KRD-184]|uniref:Uncharacterized protein n=1 Tax=Pseudonocardia oceani TaxID=2792013 RepID=A0ABS6U8R1_9PSEU|nr:hypothetical protein [Pseudonocardia oceani]MBW0090649.1 hypothetical protein [Pseudonocardia oceani]MBW0097769.1 hypothetical protein [Pseudonocardia oceani]MBW0108581.1 hypothetical protein [Pseudonocardia oceani]MBW0122315.1 hypothetical protein [Pseudonocardia oceani]MBW0128597.1 hypothetical protein [Pseudonocardia oceani]